MYVKENKEMEFESHCYYNSDHCYYKQWVVKIIVYKRWTCVKWMYFENGMNSKESDEKKWNRWTLGSSIPYLFIWFLHHFSTLLFTHFNCHENHRMYLHRNQYQYISSFETMYFENGMNGKESDEKKWNRWTLGSSIPFLFIWFLYHSSTLLFTHFNSHENHRMYLHRNQCQYISSFLKRISFSPLHLPLHSSLPSWSLLIFPIRTMKITGLSSRSTGGGFKISSNDPPPQLHVNVIGTPFPFCTYVMFMSIFSYM